MVSSTPLRGVRQPVKAKISTSMNPANNNLCICIPFLLLVRSTSSCDYLLPLRNCGQMDSNCCHADGRCIGARGGIYCQVIKRRTCHALYPCSTESDNDRCGCYCLCS